jgi:mono/diheme cytochrome c family protein
MAGGSGLAQPAPPPAPDTEAVARGRYLAVLGGCSDCHTAKDGAYAGGLPLSSSQGTLVTANITPDPETGIGSWTADDFYRAMHDGKSRKVGHLYPAFPYPHFTKVTREDSDALYAFLKTQAPVKNDPQRNQLRFPYKMRWVMAFWNGLYLHKGPMQPDPGHDAEWNRGAYIVEALAHCGACHSPKNSLQAEVADRAFQGGEVEDWFAPNLTPDPRTGLGRWSKQDIVDYLKTGRNRMTGAGGPMVGVILGSTSKIETADLNAIATYLKSQPPAAPPTPQIDSAAVERGGKVYASHCARCHASGGGGTWFAPPLNGDALVQASEPTTILRYIISGTKTPATATYPTPAQMPPVGARLSDAEVADVASYIRGAWSNRASSVTPQQVAAVRAKIQAQAAKGGG